MWYGKPVSDTEEQPKRRGRPPTGVIPKRNIRVGAVWDDVERLTQATEPGVTMTTVVTRLLERELRRLRRQAPPA